MNKNILMGVVALTAGWAAFTLLPAQEPAPPQLKTKMAKGVIYRANVSGPTVTGAPYSAVAVTDNTQVLGDGNRIVHSESQRLYRDSQGRERTEALDGSQITISDPVAKTSYRLNPQTRTSVLTGSMNVINFLSDSGDAGGAYTATVEPQIRLQAAVADLAAQQARLAALQAQGAAQQAQEFALTAQARATGGTPVTENLGSQNIEGVNATGTRSTITIPAGQIGNERPILVVDETWYSPDLKTNIKTVHTDPRSGENVYRLTQVSRAEPDAQLFQVPADYTIGGGRGGVVTAVAGGRGGRGGAGPVTAVVTQTRAPVVAGIPLVGGANLLSRVTNKVEPQYTDQARKARWQGTVTLNVVVDETGKPSDISVVKPLGLGLDEAAITAVQQWRFPPTQINGVPSKVQAQIEVPFRLQ